MYLSRRLNRSLAPPDRVSVNVTLRCNLSCTMCTTCYEAPELSLSEIKGIIDQTADWGVEVFNPLGGEPFMRGDIEEILSYAVERGFYVTVTTNGTLITEGRAAAIARIPADRLHFNFSLDGDAETNDEIRSEGMWARAIAGYQRIRSADAAVGNARRKILANTILHARNIDRFDAIMAEQAALGFDGIQILNLFRQGSEVPPEAESLWFGAEAMPALQELSASLAHRAETQGVVGYRIQNAPGSLRGIPRYYQDDLSPLEAPCWAGWKELYINADGEAIMCDGALDFLRGGFGNVHKQTLQELWASPALRARREVVRQCSTPCVQDCYLRGESDSSVALVADATRLAVRRVHSQIGRLLPPIALSEAATLCLELSDICPCGRPQCATPHHRWERLTRSITEGVHADNWSRYRDEGRVDFGRGFVGLDVVRGVVDDLQRERIRFGTLVVRWRGEPLLHPEAEPILRLLLNAIERGTVAESLLIETDGRFVTDGLAALSGHKGHQTWVLDADRGGFEAVAQARRRLEQHRRSGVTVLTAVTATQTLDLQGLDELGLPMRVGEMPIGSDAVWIRRGNAQHYAADAAATDALHAIAHTLGQSISVVRDNRPQVVVASSAGPIVSWDGKVTMDPADYQLDSPVGDVVHSALSVAWRAQR
jgi:MoaA/NifB/PqqE/SkfB family radical SAM enzyme